MNFKIIKTALPVCIGYIPMGIACGVFAQKAGMSLFEIIAFSTILYAGSGQFISIAMMMQGASALSIVLTVFIVNLRHFLFSSILLKFLQGKSQSFLSVFAHEITDESFAVNLTTFEKGDWSANEAMKLNVVCHLTWICSNAIGFIFGELIYIDVNLVAFTLTAMFIGLWSFYISERKMLLTGISAGVLAVIFSQFIGYKLHVVLAAVLASGLFSYFEYQSVKRG